MTQADDLTALLEDTSEAGVAHGKCNAVYVGFEPSLEQIAALTAYSAKFKVRSPSTTVCTKIIVLAIPLLQECIPRASSAVVAWYGRYLSSWKSHLTAGLGDATIP